MDIANLACLAIGMAVIMAAAWAVQRLTGASGWIDTIWSFAVGLGGVAAALLADGDATRRGAIILVVAVWSLRLGSHIATRTHGSDDDPRYARLIAEWGDRASIRLFLFLQIQAAAAFLLVLAVYAASGNESAFPSLLDGLGLALGLISLAGEALSDFQLGRFRKSTAARTGICDTGLWRYSRHPNYFFEWLFWCSWPLIALPSAGAAALAVIAPVMMYWLLVHVSGIPPLEAHMLQSRGERFRAHQNRVNPFFPGPRRKPAAASPITSVRKGESA